MIKKIDEVLALKLPVDMIAPSHGVIWRKDPLQIVQKYQEWAAQTPETARGHSLRHDVGRRPATWPRRSATVSRRPAWITRSSMLAVTDRNDVARRGLPGAHDRRRLADDQQRPAPDDHARSDRPQGAQVQEQDRGRVRLVRLERRSGQGNRGASCRLRASRSSATGSSSSGSRAPRSSMRAAHSGARSAK